MAREAGHSLWSPGVAGCSYFRGSGLGDTREWGFPWGLVTWQPLPSTCYDPSLPGGRQVLRRNHTSARTVEAQGAPLIRERS